MSSKRKHKTLTLCQKQEIIQKLDKGETTSNLARIYDVGRATIFDIKKNREKILGFIRTAEGGIKQRQTLKSGEFPEMENALFTWFMQERTRHTPLSGEIIREKAKFFFYKITKKDDFRASDGWLDKFKKRFGIRFLTITGEKLSSDISAVEPFQETFVQKVNQLGLLPEQIYNADESGLFWRLLPHKTLVHRSEESAPGRKMSKDRVTFMPCANSTGTHKLPLLVVGKAKRPRSFKNVQTLPVTYKNQVKGWVTRDLFSEWFNGNFIPAIKDFSRRHNLPAKALLILDNAPGHPKEEHLKSEDGLIQVMFMPPNCTPLLQPMDQNIIQQIKTNYKKSLLYDTINQTDDIAQFLKKTNLKDVVFNLAHAWNKVKSGAIQSSWKKLWPLHPSFCESDKNTADDLEENEDDFAYSNLCQELSERCGEDFQLTNEDINEWIRGTSDENLQFQTDDEIIADVENPETDISLEDESDAVPKKTVTNNEAINALRICTKWAEENNAPTDEQLSLKRLQDHIFEQMFTAKKQKTIKDYFT